MIKFPNNFFVVIGAFAIFLFLLLTFLPSRGSHTYDAVIQSNMASLRSYAETYRSAHGSYVGLFDNSNGTYLESSGEVEKIDDAIDQVLERGDDPVLSHLFCNTSKEGTAYACIAPLRSGYEEGNPTKWFCVDSVMIAKKVKQPLNAETTCL